MLLDSFINEMNMNVKILEQVSEYDPATASVVSDWKPREGDAGYSCIMYSKALAEVYFGTGMWRQEVEYVLCMKPVEISNLNRVRIDDKYDYAVDSVDDVAFQGEVMLIGLRKVK